jgi:hypothetical protein
VRAAPRNGDQVTVEPNFSPTTEQQRRTVYQVEASLVKQSQCACLPGYAVVQLNGRRLTAIVYSGVGRQA